MLGAFRTLGDPSISIGFYQFRPGSLSSGRISRWNWGWLGKQKRFLGFPQFLPIPYYALQRGYLLVPKINKWKLSFLGSKLYLVIGVSRFHQLHIPTLFFQYQNDLDMIKFFYTFSGGYRQYLNIRITYPQCPQKELSTGTQHVFCD